MCDAYLEKGLGGGGGLHPVARLAIGALLYRLLVHWD